MDALDRLVTGAGWMVVVGVNEVAEEVATIGAGGMLATEGATTVGGWRLVANKVDTEEREELEPAIGKVWGPEKEELGEKRGWKLEVFLIGREWELEEEEEEEEEEIYLGRGGGGGVCHRYGVRTARDGRDRQSDTLGY